MFNSISASQYFTIRKTNGASTGNRTRVPSLEGWYTSRCTTNAKGGWHLAGERRQIRFHCPPRGGNHPWAAYRHFPVCKGALAAACTAPRHFGGLARSDEKESKPRTHLPRLSDRRLLLRLAQLTLDYPTLTGRPIASVF